MCVERRAKVALRDPRVRRQIDSEYVRSHFLDCTKSVLAMSVWADGQSRGGDTAPPIFSHTIHRTDDHPREQERIRLCCGLLAASLSTRRGGPDLLPTRDD